LYRYSFAWTLSFLKHVTGLNLTLFILFVCSLALATNAARLLLRLTTASRVVYMPPASRPYVYRCPPIFELSSSPTMKVGTLLQTSTIWFKSTHKMDNVLSDTGKARNAIHYSSPDRIDHSILSQHLINYSMIRSLWC
jgi:hypothetical protein